MTTTSNLALAVTHLNAPVGNVLTVAQLKHALQQGSAGILREAPAAAALVAQMFVELNPRLIVLCAYEAGVDARHANMIYDEGLAQAMPRVSEWEQSTVFLR